LAIEDILRALEEKAEIRITAMKSEAEQRVNEINAEVEREASRVKRQRLKKVEDAIRSEATAVVYSATLKAKNDLIKAQEEAVDEAFKVAEGRIGELGSDERYPVVLEALLDECLEYFDDRVVLQVRPGDRPLVEGMMSKRQAQYRFSDTPLEASGGLVASSEDGDIVVYNTFDSRLEKARDKLRLAISNSMFGS